MTRDKNKDVVYFDKYIGLIDAAIEKRLADVETFRNIEGRIGRAFTLVNDAFISCIYRFSRGDRLEEMRGSILLWIQAKEIQKRVMANSPIEFKKTCDLYARITLDTVYDALTMMTFSVALHFTPEETRRLLDAIGHAGKDALMDEAARALGDVNRPVASECAFPRVYAPLLEVWRSAADQREARLREYAASWKKKISPIYWSNSLKGAEGAYFGYWCFDIALAVMLLDIPDAALRKSAYYPADLVDTARQAAP